MCAGLIGYRSLVMCGDDLQRLGIYGFGAAAHIVAQVAKRQNTHLGRSLAAHIRTGKPLTGFRYADRGNTAIVGWHAAVFERSRLKVKGWFAWLAWAVIHVYLLVGFQHRFLVSMQWLWRYMTYDRGARLIAGDYVETEDPASAPLPRLQIAGERRPPESGRLADLPVDQSR